jgi:hypothetical protein
MKKALKCGSRFFQPGGKGVIGNKDDARRSLLKPPLVNTRHPQSSQIIPLVESAKIRCKSK